MNISAVAIFFLPGKYVRVWAGEWCGERLSGQFSLVNEKSRHSLMMKCNLKLTICLMRSCSIPEHPKRPFLDQTLCKHSGGLAGRAAKLAPRCNTQWVY